MVVTENDGDHKSFDVPLTIKVEPAIDATDYTFDQPWPGGSVHRPRLAADLTDGAEKVTHLSLSGIEPGYEVWIRVGGVETQLTVSGGAVDATSCKSLLGGGQLLVRGPGTATGHHPQSHVTVTQVDVDSSATARR